MGIVEPEWHAGVLIEAPFSDESHLLVVLVIHRYKPIARLKVKC